MNLYKDVSTYNNKFNELLRVIVEIPKGSKLKYELDPSGLYLTVVRELNEKYRYPYNYGCIPQTLGGDNDPLDAIILCEEPINPMTVVDCKILGVIKTIDHSEVDDKIICVPYYIKSGEIDLKQIFDYLNNYKYPDQAGTFIKEFLGAAEAKRLIEDARLCYNLHNPRRLK